MKSASETCHLDDGSTSIFTRPDLYGPFTHNIQEDELFFHNRKTEAQKVMKNK